MTDEDKQPSKYVERVVSAEFPVNKVSVYDFDPSRKPPTEQEAEKESQARKQEILLREFTEPFWPAYRVLAWIAFRDVARLDDSLRQGIFYSKLEYPGPLLLLALQNGKIQAIEGGKKLAREAWACETGRNWSPALRFYRNEVLALWPEPTNEAPLSGDTPAPSKVKHHPTDEQARQLLNEIKATRKRVTLTAFEEMCQKKYPQMKREDRRKLSRRVVGERKRGRPTSAK
jgi:hypothetical protein